MAAWKSTAAGRMSLRDGFEKSATMNPRSMARAAIPMARHSTGRSASHRPGPRKTASSLSWLASSSQARMLSGEAQAKPAAFSLAIPLNR